MFVALSRNGSVITSDVSCFDLRVATPSLVQSVYALRSERLQGNSLTYVTSSFTQRTEAAMSNRLHQGISNYGRFYRPGRDRQAGNVRRRLIQIRIPTSTPDDLYTVETVPREPGDYSQHLSITEGQRIQNC